MYFQFTLEMTRQMKMHSRYDQHEYLWLGNDFMGTRTSIEREGECSTTNYRLMTTSSGTAKGK